MDLYFWMIAFTLFVLLMISALSIPIFSGLLAGIVAGIWAPRWFAGFYGISYDDYMVRMYAIHLIVFLGLTVSLIRNKPQEKVEAGDYDPLTEIYALNMSIGCVVVCVVSFMFFLSGLFVF